MEMGLGVGDRCGHCKQLTPVWEEAAKHLKGVVGVGAVDADAHRELGGVCTSRLACPLSFHSRLHC